MYVCIARQKTLLPLFKFPVTFAYLMGESRLFRRIVTFLIIAPYKYLYLLYLLSYLLTYCSVFVDNYLWQFYKI